MKSTSRVSCILLASLLTAGILSACGGTTPAESTLRPALKSLDRNWGQCKQCRHRDDTDDISQTKQGMSLCIFFLFAHSLSSFRFSIFSIYHIIPRGTIYPIMIWIKNAAANRSIPGLSSTVRSCCATGILLLTNGCSALRSI